MLVRDTTICLVQANLILREYNNAQILMVSNRFLNWVHGFLHRLRRYE